MSPAHGLPHDPYALAVLCPERQLERLIRQSLPPVSNLVIFAGWTEFEHAAARADCAIAAVPWLDEAAAIPGLRMLKKRAPDVPVVLITHSDPANSRLLKDVKIDDVVWINEVRPRLAATIEQISVSSFLTRVADAAERSQHLSTAVREVIGTACRGVNKVRTTSALARALGMSRIRLWREWHKVASEGLTLKHLLDWVLLIRGTEHRRAAKSWAHVAQGLGVHEQTLAHIARRLTGRRLLELEREQHDELYEMLEERVLKPLGIHLPRNE